MNGSNDKRSGGDRRYHGERRKDRRAAVHEAFHAALSAIAPKVRLDWAAGGVGDMSCQGLGMENAELRDFRAALPQDTTAIDRIVPPEELGLRDPPAVDALREALKDAHENLLKHPGAFWDGFVGGIEEAIYRRDRAALAHPAGEG
jgi:hypothetical protein